MLKYARKFQTQYPDLHKNREKGFLEMKKRISVLVLLLFVLITMVTPMVTSAATPVAKSVTLKSDNGEVKVRTGDDLKYLTDGDKLWSADGKADFNQKGIVLIQNTKADTPNYYPTCDLIIDLGGEKSIDTVNVTFFHYYMAIIDTPKDGKITVSYSTDGKSFSEIKTHTMKEKATQESAGIIDEKISLGKVYKAKAVMVSMTFGDFPLTKPVNEWFGFTELSAGLAADYKDDGKPGSTSSAASSVASSAASSAASEASSAASSAASSEVSSVASSPAAEASTASSAAATSSAVASSTASSTAAATTDNDDSNNTWVYVLIAVVAVAAIAAVIYFVVAKKKKGNA